jgi:hypothetical protein
VTLCSARCSSAVPAHVSEPAGDLRPSHPASGGGRGCASWQTPAAGHGQFRAPEGPAPADDDRPEWAHEPRSARSTSAAGTRAAAARCTARSATAEAPPAGSSRRLNCGAP